MNCAEVGSSELAERYVRDELSGAERDAFELHFLECPACLAEVRALQTAREVLTKRPEHFAAELDPIPTPNRWFWWGAVAAAALLTGVVVLVRSVEAPGEPEHMASTDSPTLTGDPSSPATELEPTGEAPTPDAPEPPDMTTADRQELPGPDSQTPAADGATRTMLLASLAEVEPPPYERVVLRGIADEATRKFDAGMTAYLAGDFQTTTEHLRQAAALDPDRPDIAFFLGASLLLIDANDEAVRELQRAVHLADPVFTEEARFYLAKAHLSVGAVESARSELSLVIESDGHFAAQAGSILQQLETLP